MEYNKITNLLGRLDKDEIPKFTSIKWIETFDQSNGIYNPGDNINIYNKKVALKNSAPFFNCILKINNQLIEDAQDLDIVMPMFNLLYCSKNFRKTTGSFWNYYPDKPNSGQDNYANLRERIIYRIKNSESFDYKTKLVGTLGNNLPPINAMVKAELDNIKLLYH